MKLTTGLAVFLFLYIFVSAGWWTQKTTYYRAGWRRAGRTSGRWWRPSSSTGCCRRGRWERGRRRSSWGAGSWSMASSSTVRLLLLGNCCAVHLRLGYHCRPVDRRHVCVPGQTYLPHWLTSGLHIQGAVVGIVFRLIPCGSVMTCHISGWGQERIEFQSVTDKHGEAMPPRNRSPRSEVHKYKVLFKYNKANTKLMLKLCGC